MAGHSKWANIKHRKAAQDAKRGKIFTRLIREIVVAAREGGGDADTNPRLRAAIDKALANNMKKDTIDTAVKRGSGDLDGDNLDELTYEGYGPGGVAILLETMTDNRNRTVSEVRYAFSKHGGNLGTDGSVAYLFHKRGVLSFAAEVDEDALMEAALEAGAEDIVTNEDGSFDVFTTPETFGKVKDSLKAAGFEPLHAEVGLLPDTRSPLTEADAETFLKLIDALEELDDVQEVYHNADIDDAILERLS
ncbi:YebC/PmpR family DNA-binding transcriptional regulator [Pseudidiomarina sp. 1APP75-32.1]|uniref:Probable transcriptional regulatory protein J6I90_07010 n=1 Tax=Pseudidiomarina terrestris TaxID=2820060 RepID=A0AAW7QWT1_9GAMM|nr:MULTISPECIES: YebC/PmpR family DNA-binding transcriptional regulator [unclassified Pseudidiomarina]MDN7124627.1 YebC/PmpR family DNA-binding transcriptional regulator [Pseudidiomarina sp. 1APP75-32.1]MDN7126827.1 YebC/PmpR family DNA-binding transcriptional regulator [Pseudidiomarina sp. 1APR75-33.1]MDN7129082.1 YebC/PmpR family DNA-binding transcriptional regulator [Pseudidiomarina sp. 1APR75-15]MDN7136676.1 YebC/PmpR family DNA-binding transcriptional regulator [Pseudidiomarina sp. 1ASP75-